MRKLLQAAMQYHRTLLRTGCRVQTCGRPSAVVSFHGTTPPPAPRQLRQGCHRLPLINESSSTYRSNRKCSTVARSVSSDQPDSAAAAPADSTDAPAATIEATAADDSSAPTESAAADHSSAVTETAVADDVAAAHTPSSSSSEPVQLTGSVHTMWAAFLQQLWDRGYFADSSTTDK
jgi:hypothetical protein